MLTGSIRATSQRINVSNVTVSFGGVQALRHVSLEVNGGERVGIIGPNGSGKSTLLNCISGLIRPTSGSGCVMGCQVAKATPRRLALSGLARTFQDVRVFGRMTVFESLLTAVQQHWRAIPSRSERADAAERARHLLEMTGIVSHRNSLARDLSYGQKKLLGIAMSMMCRPGLILLDEPFAGVNEVVAERIIESLLLLYDTDPDCAIVVVEHNLTWLRRLVDRLIVLAEGQIIEDGRPETVLRAKGVVDAYLGQS